jgi:Tfp pilus assembly protein PilV
MTRETVAFVLLAVLLVGVAATILYASRNTFERRYRRSLRQDRATRSGGRRS